MADDQYNYGKVQSENNMSPEQQAEYIKQQNIAMVANRYGDPKVVQHVTWDQLVEAGKNGTLDKLGFPDVRYDPSTGKFDTPSMFNDHPISLRPDGKGGVIPYAEEASHGWLSDHRKDLMRIAAVVAVVAGGYMLLSATGVLGAGAAAAEAAATAGTSLAELGSVGAGIAGAGAEAAGLVGAGAEAASAIGASIAEGAFGFADAALGATGVGLGEAGAAAAAGAGAIGAGEAAASTGVGAISAGEAGGAIAGLPTLTPAEIAAAGTGSAEVGTGLTGLSGASAGSEAVQQVVVNGTKAATGAGLDLGTIGAGAAAIGAGAAGLTTPPSAEQAGPTDDPNKKGLSEQDLAKYLKYIKMGLSASAALAAVKAGSGTPSSDASANGLIGKQAAVGDTMNSQLQDLYPQLRSDLDKVNAQADVNAGKVSATADSLRDQINLNTSHFNSTIAPAVDADLAASRANTTKAIAGANAAAANLGGQAAQMQSQWNSYMYPKAQANIDAGQKLVDLGSKTAAENVASAGEAGKKAQDTWNNTINPALLQQLKDGKGFADDATAKFNKYAAENGDVIANLRDRMGLSEPLVKQIIQQALEYNTAGNVERQAGLAMGDTRTQFDSQRAAELQKLQSYGIDPTSGRYQGMDTASRNNEAATSAAAATRARDAAVALGWQKQLDAISASKLSSSDYAAYGQLAGIQSGNTKAGLDAQTQQFNNLVNYNQAAGANANTAATYEKMQNDALNTGMGMTSMQQKNLSDLQAMATNYNNSYTNTIGAQTAALKTGTDMAAQQLNNDGTAAKIFDNNMSATSDASKTASGMYKDSQALSDSKLTNTEGVANTIGTNGSKVANVYGNAATGAIDMYKSDNALKAAELQGYGQAAGTFLGNGGLKDLVSIGKDVYKLVKP